MNTVETQFYNDHIKPLPKIDNFSRYLTEIIYPAMDARSGRDIPLTREQVLLKLLSIDNKKPGEAVELMDEYQRTLNKRLRPINDPDMLLEIADVVYYSQQPNASFLINNPWEFLESLGIDRELALFICIVKYSTRLKFGDTNHYKSIERIVMEKLINELST